MLIAIAVAVIAGLLILRRSTDRQAVKAARILSVAVLIGETVQDILLVKEGGDIMSFLPLHLCNLGIFVNLAASYTRGRIQAFFAEISLILIMPGSAAALLFPDWTYRPFWSVISLLCFLTHSLTVFIPLVFLMKRKAHVTFRHFWYPYLFLLLTVPPIYILDVKAGQNYMFLMYPTQDSPLSLIAGLTEEKFYLAGLAVLLTVILIIEYAVYAVAERIAGKKNQ
jgi:hypothetical integral membrane protein (TIGR02206 family)